MQHTHKKYDVTDFHGALLDILGVMNQPKRDETLLNAAGVKLDQALFPLLVAVGRYGPVGVVELADGLGRDYTTVSRQVKRLQEMELVQKQPAERDKRISEVTLTAQGKAITQHIDDARQRLMNQIFTDWSSEDVEGLFRLVRQYAEAVKAKTPPGD